MTSIVCATQTQEGTHTRNPFRRIVKRVWQGDLFPWISAERLWVKREKTIVTCCCSRQRWFRTSCMFEMTVKTRFLRMIICYFEALRATMLCHKRSIAASRSGCVKAVRLNVGYRRPKDQLFNRLYLATEKKGFNYDLHGRKQRNHVFLSTSLKAAVTQPEDNTGRCVYVCLCVCVHLLTSALSSICIQSRNVSFVM